METCVQEISHVSWKDYLPLISPVVIVLLFGIERYLSYKIRKREVERTWYYKVLIDPSLNKINDFFNQAQSIYSDSCSLLLASNQLPHDKYISLKSTQIGEFQKVKRAFDTDVITPINNRYPKVGMELQNRLLDLEDKFSNSIDNELFSQDDIDTFFDTVSEVRANWLNILYKPIQ